MGYGLRRELIDENRLSKGYLKRGQQKNLKTDHVVLRAGRENEIEVIQRIFREYVEDRKSEEEIARRRIAELDQEKIWDKPIVTEVAPLVRFFRAEDYHQGYFQQNKGQPYCQGVVAPKVAKFRKQFLGKLKT